LRFSLSVTIFLAGVIAKRSLQELDSGLIPGSHHEPVVDRISKRATTRRRVSSRSTRPEQMSPSGHPVLFVVADGVPRRTSMP